MSRPPTMAQLLKRAGLAKRPRPPTNRQQPHLLIQLPSAPRDKDGGSREGSSASKGVGRANAAREEANGSEDLGREGTKLEKDEANLDDNIAALERELAGDNDASSSSAEKGDVGSDVRSGEDGDSSSGEEENAAGCRKRIRKLVSPLASERIEPLPRHLLPLPGCGVSKKADSQKQAKKRSKVERPDTWGPPSGFQDAVRELLTNNEARSSERVPFYCRVCKFQGDSLEALKKHKQEPLHQAATAKERKISRCTLCKKQFTSPPQLLEHLSGKAHMEKLQAIMSRQGKWVPGRGTGSVRPDHSNGAGRDYQRRHSSNSNGNDGGRGRGRGRGGREGGARGLSLSGRGIERGFS